MIVYRTKRMASVGVFLLGIMTATFTTKITTQSSYDDLLYLDKWLPSLPPKLQLKHHDWKLIQIVKNIQDTSDYKVVKHPYIVGLVTYAYTILTLLFRSTYLQPSDKHSKITS